jgi:hypothetical protein
MPDRSQASTPPGAAKEPDAAKGGRHRRLVWYYMPGENEDGEENQYAPPLYWICPRCELLFWGSRSCPKCGLVALGDEPARLDSPQHLAHTRDGRRWKQFAKGRR